MEVYEYVCLRVQTGVYMSRAFISDVRMVSKYDKIDVLNSAYDSIRYSAEPIEYQVTFLSGRVIEGTPVGDNNKLTDDGCIDLTLNTRDGTVVIHGVLYKGYDE